MFIQGQEIDLENVVLLLKLSSFPNGSALYNSSRPTNSELRRRKSDGPNGNEKEGKKSRKNHLRQVMMTLDGGKPAKAGGENWKRRIPPSRPMASRETLAKQTNSKQAKIPSNT